MKVQTERVVCRFSPDELSEIDNRRGELPRGTYVRLAALDNVPKVIPALNRQAYVDLSRAAANLNQLAKHANQNGELDISELSNALSDFRVALIGVKL